MLKDFYVGVKGIVRVGDKCLVLIKSERGMRFWDIPGGRIDDGETIEQTLEREMREELPSIGIYEVKKLAGAHRLSHDLPDGKGLILLFYILEAEPFEVELSTEHDGYKWVSADSLSELKDSPEIQMEPGYYNAVKAALE